ncbi:MAG: radical SAM protein [Fidelibacterota bacterium]
MSESGASVHYGARLALLAKEVLYQSLDADTQGLVEDIGIRCRLSFQELRQIVEIAVDLRMWGEPSLEQEWDNLKKSAPLRGNLRKDNVLRDLKDRWLTLRQQETVYGPQGLPNSQVPNANKKRLLVRQRDNGVVGMCPVASEKTVCCNLRTIDAVQGCGLGCSYCSVQTFYDATSIAVDGNLSEKLKNIRLDPRKNYHICSGQSSDSLVLGNRKGILEAQFQFARRNPNIILEFKTKSKNVAFLLESDVPTNVLVSWSLNPQTVIDNEEHLTASLMQRLRAARSVADRGIRVGFHFHPIVHYRGWKIDYQDLIQTVISTFSPHEAALVSFGTLTFIKPVIKSLRLSGIRTKVLQIPMEETAGKLSYPERIKEEMFRTAWDAFGPWHGKVFFYLCMESRELWESVFGRCYDNNEEFEQAMLDALFHKLKLPVPTPQGACDRAGSESRLLWGPVS